MKRALKVCIDCCRFMVYFSQRTREQTQAHLGAEAVVSGGRGGCSWEQRRSRLGAEADADGAKFADKLGICVYEASGVSAASLICVASSLSAPFFKRIQTDRWCRNKQEPPHRRCGEAAPICFQRCFRLLFFWCPLRNRSTAGRRPRKNRLRHS